MRRLALLALVLLAGCQRPHYHRYPVATVDSLRAQLELAGPATLRVYDSAGTQWLHLEPTAPTDGQALAPVQFQPLNKSWECPPICP